MQGNEYYEEAEVEVGEIICWVSGISAHKYPIGSAGGSAGRVATISLQRFRLRIHHRCCHLRVRSFLLVTLLVLSYFFQRKTWTTWNSGRWTPEVSWVLQFWVSTSLRFHKTSETILRFTLGPQCEHWLIHPAGEVLIGRLRAYLAGYNFSTSSNRQQSLRLFPAWNVPIGVSNWRKLPTPVESWSYKALGSFVSHRGLISPCQSFLIVWRPSVLYDFGIAQKVKKS